MALRTLLALGLVSAFVVVPACTQESHLDPPDRLGEAPQADGTCTFQLLGATTSIPAAGGSGLAKIEAASSCAWTASTSAAWITLSAPLSGTSAVGNLFYSVALNPGAARTGTITFGGLAITVTQDAGVSCAAGTQNGNCVVTTTNNGSTSGSCASGYWGSCSYSCNDGTWTQVSDACVVPTTVVSTLNLAGHSGYMISNTACGGNCNIGGTDPQEAAYACQAAGFGSLVTYSVASASFYPCWCLDGSSCCADNPNIPTAAMITSVTCTGGAPCAAGTESGNCAVEATNSGGTSGTCIGSKATCSYSCNNGTWTQVSNTCPGPTVVSTLNLAGHSGYMLSNTACGGNCNIGGTDQQEATYACQQAGYSTAQTYSVANASFYPCWCLDASSCCADNPNIPTAAMITSVTCQ